MSSKIFLPDGKPVTPFNPQLQHFDFICGQVIQENKILKFVVVISCIAFFLSIAITLFAVTQPDTVPVVITMNDLGELKYVGKITRKNYQNFSVPELALQYQVKEFVKNFYTLSIDKTVMNNQVDKLYSILTNNTASNFSQYIENEKPFENFGSRTRDVQFQTEPLKLSNKTYQIDFEVFERNLSGSVLKHTIYRAVTSIELLEPNEKDMQENPLGIYISSYDIKKLKEIISE